MAFGAVVLCACDLQPKISSIPDSIGEFISQRYPALLADPVAEPEIYNSAVTDYGVYASPELYGGDTVDDYVLYASVDDYVLSPNDSDTAAQIEQAPSIEQPVSIEMTPVETDEKDDYLVVPQYTKAVESEGAKEENSDFVTVVRGDTLYAIARKNNTTVADLAKINSLKEPYTLSIGQKLQVRSSNTDKKGETTKTAVVTEVKQPAKVVEKPKEITPAKTVKTEKQPVKTDKTVKVAEVKTAEVKRIAVKEITVEKGDTLYSLSRQYQIPVNDLAVMNKLSNPFTLTVGQKLKVPKLDNVQVRSSKEIQQIKASTPTKKAAEKTAKITPTTNNKTTKTTKTTQNTKISSDPKKQLPKISARSASKFSWPVRGKILSQYGAKNKGLFNDGINIGAAQGTAVKAAENGVVAYAGNEVKGMGNLIIVQHSDGWMTVYAHLDSMSVRRGNKVNVGQQIGKVGKTGKVDKPQLHFEIRKGTKAYNPVSYLKK